MLFNIFYLGESVDKTSYKPEETLIPPTIDTDDTLQTEEVSSMIENQTVEDKIITVNSQEQAAPNQDYQESNQENQQSYQENQLPSYQNNDPPTQEENPQSCQKNQQNYHDYRSNHHQTNPHIIHQQNLLENIPQNYQKFDSLPGTLNHEKPLVNQYNHMNGQPPAAPRMPQPHRAPAFPVRENLQMYHSNPPDYPPPQLINAHIPQAAMDQRVQYPQRPPSNEHPSRPNRHSGGRGNRSQNSFYQENQFNCPQVI